MVNRRLLAVPETHFGAAVATHDPGASVQHRTLVMVSATSAP